MRFHKNNMARVVAAVFCFIIVLMGISKVGMFFDAVATAGKSGHSPADVLIGGLLFSVATIGATGLCRIFFEKN